MTTPDLRRLPDWAARLHDHIDATKREAFAWDGHDCFGWVAGAVKAMTGTDIARGRRGYRSAEGALKRLRKDGFADLAEGMASVLPEVHPVHARLGDIAAIPEDSPFGFTLGIVNGETILVLREDGMGIVHRDRATRAFRVGL